MTELLKELEAVVGDLSKDSPAPRFAGALEIRCANFLRTHNAEIAEALKDARRWLYVLNNAEWIRDEDDTLMAIRLPPLTDLSSKGTRRDAIDTAIDAHNSAREVGE
jgi:hypothetical protein